VVWQLLERLNGLENVPVALIERIKEDIL